MAGRRVVVVGAGITGLTVAHRLVVDHPQLEVTVLEASTITGGKLRTTPLTEIGIDVDEGADAFLVRVPWAVDLCTELGLADDLVAPSARRASLWLDARLRPIPSPNVLGVPLDPTAVAPGLVADADLERLAGAGRPDSPLPDGDLSVGRVIRACVGDTVFERLVDPLIGGVNAGRADDLSCATMAPGLLTAARNPDGLLATLRQANRTTDPTTPVFNAPAGGMGRLVGELARRLGDRIRIGVEVTGIDRTGGDWVVRTSDGTPAMAEAVVVATPAHVAATLVAAHSPAAASALDGLRHASVVVATMAWRRADLEVPADQSGFLVGRGEGLLMTACSFAGSKWAHLDNPDHTILRVSCGRIDDERHDRHGRCRTDRCAGSRRRDHAGCGGVTRRGPIDALATLAGPVPGGASDAHGRDGLGAGRIAGTDRDRSGTPRRGHTGMRAIRNGGRSRGRRPDRLKRSIRNQPAGPATFTKGPKTVETG